MTRWVTAAVLMLLAMPVMAQTVSVRSGDHPTFARLVLSIPAGQDWQVGRAQGGYAVRLGEGGADFDTSDVFDRIPVTRIASLGEADGQLVIELACDCHADAFLWRPDRLVVDIVDGPPPSGSPFEIALGPEPEAAPDMATEPGIVLPIVTERPPRAAVDPLIAGAFAVTPPDDTRVADAERAVIESLARAASQGVFAMPSRPLPFVADRMEDGETVEQGQGLPVLTPVTDPMDGVPARLEGPTGANGPGLVLRTSIQRGEDGQPGAPEEAGHCIADTLVSVQDWGDDRDYATQVAERRRALTTEFDAYPPGAIEEMARTYLYFGFGQEARQVLSLDGQRSRERMVLDAMSRLVDGLPAPPGVLDDQLDCDGFVILWAALAAGTIAPVGETGRAAAIMAFRLLPDGLHGHLGADLAQLFLDAGDAVTADIVMTAASSRHLGRDVETDLTSAAVIAEIDGPDAAIAALETMATGDARMTPDGLIRLIGLQLAQGQTVDAALTDLAAVMRFEAGRSPEAADLARAEVAAHLASDGFDTAMAILDDATVPLDAESRGAMISQVYAAIAERQEAAAFLTSAFDPLPATLDPGVENAIAERLIGLGFPERALELLAGPAVQDAMADRRYLRAEAAAIMGDPAGVELALSGLTDARAAAIRSRVLAATGDYERALAQDLLAAATPEDPAGAWRAGAWTLLEAGEDELLQNASRAILTEAEPPAASLSLAERRALLEQAEATRTMTTDLLGRFVVAPVE